MGGRTEYLYNDDNDMMDKLLEHIVSVGLGHEVGGGDIVRKGPRPGVEHRLLVPVLHCELPDNKHLLYVVTYSARNC